MARATVDARVQVSTRGPEHCLAFARSKGPERAEERFRLQTGVEIDEAENPRRASTGWREGNTLHHPAEINRIVWKPLN